MNYPHLWSRLYGAPLLIHRDKAAVIEQVFRAHLAGESAGRVRLMEEQEAPSPEELAALEHERRMVAYAGVPLQRRDDKPYALTESGIAIVPVMGTLVQRGSWMDSMSGLTSYDRVLSMVERARDDKDVRGTLLELDTPGGEGSGLPEAGNRVRLASQVKPLWAHANEQAYSAGYWLGASANRFVLPISGYTGSIGALALFVDQSKRDGQMGYSYTYITDGDEKADGNPHEPLSDRVRSSIQSEVNRFGLMFRTHVATMRGIEEPAVRATQAGILNPPEAVEGGFADAIATFADTVGAFEESLDAASKTVFLPGKRTASQSTSTRKETSMTTENQSAAATLTAEQTQEHQRQVTAARTAGEQSGREAGVKAERERIAAITGCDEAKGRTTLARHISHDTDMNVDAAKKLLAASPVEATGAANPLAAAMGGIQNPKVGASDLGGGEDDVDATARRIAGYSNTPAKQP